MRSTTRKTIVAARATLVLTLATAGVARAATPAQSPEPGHPAVSADVGI